jgi:hypothetical protein
MREGAEAAAGLVPAYLKYLRSVSLGPLPLPGEPLPDARKRCALGAKALITFLILSIKVRSSLLLRLGSFQRALHVNNVANLRHFCLSNWYVQFLILIVASLIQESSK